MIGQTLGLHHANIRKRIYKKNEQFPHPNKFKRFMDKAIFFVGIVGPIMTIPQILQIWMNHLVSGVSVVTWSAYIFTGAFWLIYGILHNEKPIIFANIAWIISEFLIVLGFLIYS